jgi:hypothetical protein
VKGKILMTFPLFRRSRPPRPRPTHAASPADTCRVSYGTDGRIEMVGYSMTDCLRFLDGLSSAASNAASDAMTARFPRGDQ